MADETKVRLKLDTEQAKAEMNSLMKDATKMAGRIGSGIRSTVGKGLGYVGLGGAIGTGMAAVQSATQSGVGDIVGESLGGLGARMQEFFLGDLPQDARASKAAREETIQAFGAIAGHTGKVPPQAAQYFASVKSLRMEEEQGRHLFEKDDQYRGKGMEEIIDKICTAIGGYIKSGIERLGEILNIFDGK